MGLQELEQVSKKKINRQDAKSAKNAMNSEAKFLFPFAFNPGVLGVLAVTSFLNKQPE
jgi:hypothetical protein